MSEAIYRRACAATNAAGRAFLAWAARLGRHAPLREIGADAFRLRLKTRLA